MLPLRISSLPPALVSTPNVDPLPTMLPLPPAALVVLVALLVLGLLAAVRSGVVARGPEGEAMGAGRRDGVAA